MDHTPPDPRPQDRPAASHGFTLLEMLMALLVFALAALALMRLDGASLAQTGALEQRLLTEITARNLAVELLTDPRPPSFGEETGTVDNGGQSFAWQRETRPAAEGRLVEISLTVTDAQGVAVTLDFARVAQ